MLALEVFFETTVGPLWAWLACISPLAPFFPTADVDDEWETEIVATDIALEPTAVVVLECVTADAAPDFMNDSGGSILGILRCGCGGRRNRPDIA